MNNGNWKSQIRAVLLTAVLMVCCWVLHDRLAAEDQFHQVAVNTRRLDVIENNYVSKEDFRAALAQMAQQVAAQHAEIIVELHRQYDLIYALAAKNAPKGGTP